MCPFYDGSAPFNSPKFDRLVRSFAKRSLQLL